MTYRRRSPSTSDRSSIPSRSPSPVERRRSVHRLPTTNVPIIQPSPNVSSTTKSKKAGKQRNGQARNARNAGGKQPVKSMDEEVIDEARSMPPPPAPPLRSTRPLTPDLPANPANGLPPKPISLPEKPTRIVPAKGSGFKPIGQPNSALKMFFPGDEDEADLAASSGHRKGARVDAPPPFKNTTRASQPSMEEVQALQYLRDSESLHGIPRSALPFAGDAWDSRTDIPDPRNIAQAYGARREQQSNGSHCLFAEGQGHDRSMTPQGWSPAGLPPRPDANEWAAKPPVIQHPSLPLHPGPAPQFVRAQDHEALPPYLQDRPANFVAKARSQPTVLEPASTPPPEKAPQPIRRSTPQPSPLSAPVSQPSPAWPPPTTSSTTEPPAVISAGTNERKNKDLYVILNQVGEGTFGKVYKARNSVAQIYVALKRIRMETEKDGFPVTAMREIKLLQTLKHENVVRLYEMMVSNGAVYMVFEYMDHDLTGILSQSHFKFSEAHLKSLCKQMLQGLAHLHRKGVIHRDIKGSNILLNSRGELKLADFGLARFYQKRRRTDYTNRVITLWYRPPELLLGSTVYGPEVDMWSAGCIMLELYTKKPVFQGNDEIHQLSTIWKLLGTPTPERWPGLLTLPWYELIKPRDALPNRFKDLFQKYMPCPTALDLAERLLTYDPERRVTAQEALEAPYFQQEPLDELPSGLSTLEGEWHELETKQERMKKRKKPESSAGAA